MKTIISALAVAAALTAAAPVFAASVSDVPGNARNELLSTARSETFAPAQRSIAGQRFAPSFETSAQTSAPASTVDNVR